jgi:hypothetical protein
MPHPRKSQTQSDAIYVAEGLLAASIALEDAPDLDLFVDEDVICTLFT